MKIAVIDNLPEGGAKRVVFEQIKYLAQKHSIWYGTNNVVAHIPFDSLPITMQRFDLSVEPHTGWSRFQQEWSLLFGLRKKYKKVAEQLIAWKPDIVIAHPCLYTQAPILLHFLPMPTIYFAEEWLRLIYEPQLFPLPSTSFHKKVYEKYRRQIIKYLDAQAVSHATCIVTTSNYNAQHLYQAYGIHPDVIHLGVDNAVFQAPRRRTDNDTFLFIGQKDEVHGYPLIEEAISRSSVPINISIISQDKETYSKSDAELVQEYASATAVLCLDRGEPFGLIPLEAMSCETPVIAVAEGGYLETIQQNKTGLLIKRDANELLDAMLSLARDPHYRSLLGKNGRHYVQKNFSWERHGQQLEALIDKIL